MSNFHYLLLYLCISCVSSVSCKDDLQENVCNSVEIIDSHFPDDFFLKGPSIQIIDDTLNIKAVLTEENWHQIYFSAIAFRVNHVLDSVDCTLFKSKLREDKVLYHLYPKYERNDNVATFGMGGNFSLAIWDDEWFRSLNKLIITSNPSSWVVIDMLLKEYSNSSSTGTFLTSLYGRSISERGINTFDSVILKKLASNSEENHDLVDSVTVKKFVKLMLETEELVIEDQIPDHLKKKDE